MIIGIISTYLISLFIVYFHAKMRGDFDDNYDMGYRVFLLVIMLMPGINSLFAFFAIILESGRFLNEYIKEYKKNRKERKERKQKIKLGIIKITPEDPYGEEDWS